MFTQNKTPQTKAEVKEGALILYLPSAIKPCVWRMDLDILSETSIEIDEKDGIYILATRDINGVTKAIAGFHDKAEAEKALGASLHALMKNYSGESTSTQDGWPIKRIAKWAISIIFALWLVTLLLGIPAPQTVEIADTQEPALVDETGNLKVGVPIDVDRLFDESGE